jgi:hypothetical protein
MGAELTLLGRKQPVRFGTHMGFKRPGGTEAGDDGALHAAPRLRTPMGATTSRRSAAGQPGEAGFGGRARALDDSGFASGTTSSSTSLAAESRLHDHLARLQRLHAFRADHDRVEQVPAGLVPVQQGASVCIGADERAEVLQRRAAARGPPALAPRPPSVAA